MRLFGIDGCRGGWLVAGLVGAALSFALEEDFGCFAAQLLMDDVVAIDIPIGLQAASSWRECDRLARARLGQARRGSVFPAPCRGTLSAEDYVRACALNRAACGSAISIELWNILPKICSVDSALNGDVAEQVWEAHPEVSFADLAGSPFGLTTSKKTVAGMAERRKLLAARGMEFDPFEERSRLGARHVAVDDILDAAACLLTAQHIAGGTARHYPSDPPARDSKGLRMQIVS